MARRQPPLALFAETPAGRYRLCPDRLATGAGQTLADLRAQLDPARLESFGIPAANVTDEVLAAAAQSGILANPAFLDIVDSHLAYSGCLCCSTARNRAAAAAAEGHIRTLQAYYDQASYQASGAYYRLLGALARDVHATEGAMAVRARRRRGDDSPDLPGGSRPASGTGSAAAREAVAALNRAPGLYAVSAAGHRPGPPGVLAGSGQALWLYSTPEARRYLRRLARDANAAGLSLTTRVAVGAPEFLALRHKHRAFRLEFHGEGLSALAVWAVVARAAAPRKPAPRKPPAGKGRAPPGLAAKGPAPPGLGPAAEKGPAPRNSPGAPPENGRGPRAAPV